MANNTVNTATPSSGINPIVLQKIKIPRKFEIFVEEFDEEKGWKPVVSATLPGMTNSNPIITVNSQADLQEKINLYKSMEQRFKIIREIDPPSKETICEIAKQQGIDPETGDKLDHEKNNSVLIENTNKLVKDDNIKHNEILQDNNIQINNKNVMTCKPKIVTIGDLQIKYDGNKVYQKQWMQLTQAEAANFRIVNDNNNKIFSLNGKHIEMKKWVLIEDKNISEVDSTENLINE